MINKYRRTNSYKVFSVLDISSVFSPTQTITTCNKHVITEQTKHTNHYEVHSATCKTILRCAFLLCPFLGYLNICHRAHVSICVTACKVIFTIDVHDLLFDVVYGDRIKGCKKRKETMESDYCQVPPPQSAQEAYQTQRRDRCLASLRHSS